MPEFSRKILLVDSMLSVALLLIREDRLLAKYFRGTFLLFYSSCFDKSKGKLRKTSDNIRIEVEVCFDFRKVAR